MRRTVTRKFEPFSPALRNSSARCSPAPPLVPPLRWSPDEASMPPGLACLLPTTTPRDPTATSPSTLAASGLALASGLSRPLGSSPPLVLLFTRPTRNIKLCFEAWDLSVGRFRCRAVGLETVVATRW